MATIAKFTLTSAAGDVSSTSLNLTTESTLTKAGGAVGLTDAAGLTRKTFSSAAAGNIQAENIYRSSDATSDGANKVYLKNTSSTTSEYFTVHVDGEELGRLYAGDWAFFPWSATDGTKAYFTLTIAGSWVSGDTWEFDGVTATATNSTESDFAAIIDATNYPNWTTDHAAGETTIVFHQRNSGGLTNSTAVTADGTKSSSSGTAVISSAHVGSKAQSDITVRPSVHTAMTLEHMLLNE